MTNLGRCDQYYNNKNENKFYDEGRSYNKIEVIIGTIRISGVGTTLEMIGIEVNLLKRDRTERSNDRARSRDRNNRGRFIKNGRDSASRNRGGSTSRDKSEERRCYYCWELGQFGRQCQKRDQGKQGGQKEQMQ